MDKFSSFLLYTAILLLWTGVFYTIRAGGRLPENRFKNYELCSDNLHLGRVVCWPPY